MTRLLDLWCFLIFGEDLNPKERQFSTMCDLGNTPFRFDPPSFCAPLSAIEPK